MADIKDVLNNIEQIYHSNNSLNLLKDFERVLDELDLYVYDNWIDGELVSGPFSSRYFVTCTFMWPMTKMPDPQGGLRLTGYGCKVEFAEDYIAEVRKIKKPDDIRPGTRKGKIDYKPIWMVKITMPKRLMHNIETGYKEIDANKIQDVLDQGNMPQPTLEPVEQQIEQEEPTGEV